MTITQIVQNQQHQRISEITQKTHGKPQVNPNSTPGISLMGLFHMKNVYGVSDGEDISKVIRDYTMSLAPEQRLSASWTLNELFHSEAARLGEYVHQQDPDWDWGKPFDTSILDGYQQGVDILI